jgi:gamma-glutamyltranspeptidase/glutathione hydrolase
MVDVVRLNWRGLDLITPPPPSGGLTSLSIVQTLEQFELRGLEPWGGYYFHLLGETTKACWQERQRRFGDPEFVDLSIDALLSPSAAEARADVVRSGSIARGAAAANQSPHTSNVIAADSEGNVISLTATQGWQYGSHLVVDGMGLVLNHGMSRFEYVPGHPNAPAAGKRMQHNMSPLVALKDGRPAFAVGMPGGPKIVNVTAQVVMDLVAFGATPAEAIEAPRLHTEGDEPLAVSTHMPDAVVVELERFGHAVRREEDMGGPVNVLAVDPPAGAIDVASGEGTGAVAGW